MKTLSQEDLPRERLLRYGAESLSAAELIAIILCSGFKGKPVLLLAQEILQRFGSLHGVAEASVQELCQVKGLGAAKAIELKAAVSLGLKAAKRPSEEKRRVRTPLQAYTYIRDQFHGAKEERLLAILLDVKSFVIKHELVGVGTLSQTLVHPREVFYPAIRHKAASLVLAHNHPSGDPTPSSEDLKVTRQLAKAGEVLGIRLNDHLIVGHEAYVSLREYDLEGWS